MGVEERQEVSERMKKYWASRRGKQRKKAREMRESDARTANGG